MKRSVARTLSRAFTTGLATCIGMLTLGHALQAQGAGVIRGAIVDSQRAPVPFATVTVTSAAMQGQRTTTTSADGRYALAQLPAGDYEVAIEATRLAPARRIVTVFLGSAVELNVTLVDAGSPDRGGPLAAGANASSIEAAYFRHDLIAALPTTRTLFAIGQLAPGVLAAPSGQNQLTIHGAFAYDNALLVNGVDVADNLSGSPLDLYIEDAIQETAVLTSGVSAEHGRLTGGVVSAVTKSGGNRFSGSYRANLSNPSWTEPSPFELCDPSVTIATCRTASPRPDVLRASHEGTLGGFIVKDRLWFFSAGRLAKESTARFLPQSGALSTETTSNQRGEAKVTATVGRGHTLTFDTAANKTTDDDRPSFGSTVDPAAIGNRSVPSYYDVASYRATIGKRGLVDGQVAVRRWERHETASVGTAIVDSPMFARTIAAGGSRAQYNAPYFDAADPEKRNTLQGAGNVGYLVDAGGGHHEVRGGYEFFRSQRIGGGSQSPTGYVFDTDYLMDQVGAPVLDANGRFIPLWVPGATLIENWIPVRGATFNVDTQSVYVQDHVTIGDRLSADVGLRHERSRADATGSFSGIKSRTTQPRLAASYRVGNRFNQVVRATYGQYAGRLDEAQIAQNTSIANPDHWVGVYFGGIGQGRSFSAALNPANYLTLAGQFPTRNVSVDGQLLPPLVREFTTSYTLQPGNGKGLVEVAYVWRDWSRFIEDFVSLANGTTQVVKDGFDVGTFTNVVYRNTDDAKRRYSAIDLFGQYRIDPRWQAGGSFTLQLRNDGNDVVESNGLPATIGPLGNYPEIFSADRHYPTGRLPLFERGALRLWSTGQVDFGRLGALSIAGLLRVDAGRPYSLVAINQPLSAVQDARLRAAGYPDKPASQDVFFGARGAERFNSSGVVDVAVAYDIPIFKVLRPWAKLDVYNALNNQRLISFDTTVTPDPSSPTDALGLATGYRAAPTFGKATSSAQFASPFQGETGGRTWRVALGVRF